MILLGLQTEGDVLNMSFQKDEVDVYMYSPRDLHGNGSKLCQYVHCFQDDRYGVHRPYDLCCPHLLCGHPTTQIQDIHAL
jgi:hypothetical protein